MPAKCPEDYERALSEHVKLLRSKQALRDALFIICPESNLGFESSHIARIMRKFKYTVIMYESTNGCPGLHTSHKVKEIIHTLLSDRLDAESVFFSSELVSSGSVETVKDMLLTQVQNYNIILDVPDKMRHFQKAKKTYSGKHHGQDDLAVMLQFNLLVHQRFYKNPRYNSYW